MLLPQPHLNMITTYGCAWVQNQHVKEPLLEGGREGNMTLRPARESPLVSQHSD